MKLSISDGTANYQIPLTTADFKSADTLRKALHSHAPDVAARATDQAIAQLLKLFSGVDVSRLDEPFAMPLAALASKDGNIVKAFSLRMPEARSALQPERATSKHAPSMPRGVDVEMQEFHKPRLDVALLPKLKSEGEKLTKNQAAQQPAVDKLASELATHTSTLVADRRALFRAVSELPAYDPLQRDFGLSKLVALDGAITTLGDKQAKVLEDHAALVRERSRAATAWRGSRTPDEAQERLATLTSLDGQISAKLSEAAELARQLPTVTAELHTEFAALADLGPAINALKAKIGGAVATTGPLVAKLETARDELRETERSLAVNASLVKHLPLIVKSEKHSSLEALGRLRDFNPYTTSGDTVLYREALAALGGDDTIIKATINAFEDLKKAGATIAELEQFLSDAGVPNHWRPVTFVTEVRAFKELTALFEAERAKSAAAPLPEKSIKQKLHASLEGLLAKHGIGVDERQQQALVDLVNLTSNAYDPNDRVLQRMHDEAVLVGMARLVQSGIMGLGTFLPFYKDLSAALSLTDAVVGAAKRYSKASGDGTLVGESRVRDDGFENALMQSQRRENQLLAKHIGDAVVASLGIATLAAAAHPPAAFVLKAVKLGLQGTNVAGHQLYDWSIASKAKALLTLAMSNEPGAAAAQVELFKYSTKYAKGLLALGATKGDSTALHYVASRGLSEDEIASSSFTIIRAFLLEAAAEKDVQQTFGELYADVLSGARSGLGKAWDKVQELVASKPEPKEDEGVELTDLRGRS